MAEYGVYMTTSDGRVFITPQTTPVSLFKKITGSGNGVASASLTIDTSMVNIPFVVANAAAFPSMSISGNTMTIDCHTQDDNGGNISFEAYIFSTVPPTLPKWGAAIWGPTGKLILTNETRVLTDIKTIGTKGENTAGAAINQTLDGKWAIMPDLAGVLIGVYQQRPVQIGQPFFAKYTNGKTQITSVLASAPPPGISGSINNSKNSVKAINAALYD